MALATICPHCNTTFRVASDQLKLRGGIVRCGACNEVFDGNAALVDAAARQAAQPPAVDAPPPPPDTSASDAFDAEIAEIEAKETEPADAPVFTLDFDTTFDPIGIWPKPGEVSQPEPEPEPEPAPETEREPEPAPQPEPEGKQEPDPEPDYEPEPEVDEEIVALPPPDDEPITIAAHGDQPDSLAPFLMRASAAAEAAPPDAQAVAVNSPRRSAVKRNKAARPAPVVMPADLPEPVVEDEPVSDEPEFVRRSRRQEETGRTRRIVLLAASALLLLALCAQTVATFRNVLAAHFPGTRPVLVATCAVFGCKVELPAQIDTLSVETGELQSLGGNAFSYTTLLRNPGTLAQAWPHIELALTDANDKPLVRRVFTPAQYLPPGVAAAKGFGPRSEQAVKLFFELNQIKASGYHIAIFYP
jgi:predicted Zn finger-like uncharacterized protein